jgi:hypothetical protein
MNALALWLPGTLLVVAGVVLLVLQHTSWEVAIAIIVVGVALETAGVVLWVRQRSPRRKA